MRANKQGRKACHKTFLVSIISENVTAFNPANNDVMQDVGYVKAWLAWHEQRLT